MARSPALLLALPLLVGAGALVALAQDRDRGGLRVQAENPRFALEGSLLEPRSVRLAVGNGGPDRAGSIDWSVRCDADWVRLSSAGGRLGVRERGELEVSIDLARATQLGPGEHVARLEFVNETDGRGTTARRVVLGVRGMRGLEVSSWDAAAGGYRLRNAGSAPVDWQARSFEPWLEVEPRRGTLEPGAEVLVTAAARADARAREHARGGVAFLNATDGVGTTTRVLLHEGGHVLPIDARPAEGAGVRSLSRFGITWTFDRPVEHGTFANGDPWVVGPVLVTSVSPPSLREGGRVSNGSMINPSPKRGIAQGYDSATYGKYAEQGSWVPALNAAFEASERNPVVLPTHSSLVSSISDRRPGARPQLTSAAVLTVLDRPAPADAFRPPYSGADKTIRHRTSELRREQLPSLARTPSTPSLAEVERMFERPWIDHGVGWPGRYLHPAENMPDYGREITDHVSTGAAMLLLDFPLHKKETLLVRYVQLGIDLYGLLLDGCTWPPSAGHLNGRKWPILFAGLMLADEDMQRIGFDYPPETFSEDGQTFYVEEERPEQGYVERHLGLAEWGTTHIGRPELDDPRWLHTEPFPPGTTKVELRTQSVKYRTCCTANTFWGQLLAARVLGAKELWNHDALFDYQDRYLEENTRRRVSDYRLSWRPFYLELWRRYRSRY